MSYRDKCLIGNAGKNLALADVCLRPRLFADRFSQHLGALRDLPFDLLIDPAEKFAHWTLEDDLQCQRSVQVRRPGEPLVSDTLCPTLRAQQKSESAYTNSRGANRLIHSECCCSALSKKSITSRTGHQNGHQRADLGSVRVVREYACVAKKHGPICPRKARFTDDSDPRLQFHFPLYSQSLASIMSIFSNV